MADVNITETELDYIGKCAMGNYGVLVEKPSAPFPSLYRKGILRSKGGCVIVGEKFRDMFRLDDTVTTPALEVKSAYEEKRNVSRREERAKPLVTAKAYTPDHYAAPEGMPDDYQDFVNALCAATTTPCTRCLDELSLVSMAGDVKAVLDRWDVTDEHHDVRQHSGACRRRAWRFRLAGMVADYFGVDAGRDGSAAIFTGEAHSATAARVAYECLLKVGNRRAQRAYDAVLVAGKPTVGVYEAAANEFIAAAEKFLV